MLIESLNYRKSDDLLQISNIFLARISQVYFEIKSLNALFEISSDSFSFKHNFIKSGFLLLISLKIINPSFIKSVSYLSFDLYQKVFAEKKDSEVVIIDIDEKV